MKKEITIFTLILLVDQILKFWVKTHMFLGQEFHVFGNWFIIHFVESDISKFVVFYKFLIILGIIVV